MLLTNQNHFKKMEEGNSEGSKKRTSGSLYTVEERLDTFKGSHWPFESGSCTPLKMAEAGFYYCGTPTHPDWVRCIVCHHEMDGWEETDDPWEEHKQHKASCAFIKKIRDPYMITFGEVIELEKEAIKCYVKKETEILREKSYSIWEGTQSELMNSIVDQQ